MEYHRGNHNLLLEGARVNKDTSGFASCDIFMSCVFFLSNRQTIEITRTNRNCKTKKNQL